MSERDDARDRAERSFKQAEDGKVAMAEHHAERRALRDRTARLREQRLAKEIAERESPRAPSRPDPQTSRPVRGDLSAPTFPRIDSSPPN